MTHAEARPGVRKGYSMFDDYIVDQKFRNELQIIAVKTHVLLNKELRSDFSVFNALKRLETVDLPKKGRLQIRSEKQFTTEPLAFVEHTPSPVLHIDKDIWQEMRDGFPFARHLGAHELGHVLLHNHYAMGFHGSPSEFATAFGEERSAEWQANIFALFFLMPEKIICAYSSEQEISVCCSVELEQVRQRIELFEKMNRIEYLKWRSNSLTRGWPEQVRP